MPEKVLNHLAGEKSPYLLQHAANPVGWYPWGDEALRKARNDGKPILLSIGYATCHWCHRMAHESFEDKKVADLINRNFIPIKVDREERPDVDSYYMSAVQGMTGSGGWPLTVFVTPDLKAFYGGTYYPPEPKYGMPSFTQVLEFVAKLWKDNRVGVTQEAERISGALQVMQKSEGGGSLTPSLLDDAFASLAASFDGEYGGFGGAPKFPNPLSLEFMLLHHFRTGKELALRTAVKTLEAMAAGGIHDHVAGGFHRYSTDKQWLVPHFEKMLYDNALLARVYLHAYQVTGNRRLADVASGTLGWMLAELGAPGGGFYSAQDADTHEGEGVYYTWTPEEVAAVLGSDAGAFCQAYGVTKNGNFEGGRSILHITQSSETEKPEMFAKSKKLLYRARLSRPRPATDSKVLTSWNGLAITSLALAYQVLDEQTYLDAARRAAEFLLSNCFREGALLRRFAGGEAGIPATLEDYAFLGLGLLDLFEATSDPRWLEHSVELARIMLRLFEDKDLGGFYTSEGDVPARLVETYDGPTPSGNSAAIALLVRLSAITGSETFSQSTEKALRRFQPAMDKEPSSHSFMLWSVDAVLNGTREVVISAKTPSSAQPLLGVFRGRFLPDTTSFVLTDQNKALIQKLSPLTEGREPAAKPLAFVCQHFACKLPSRTPAELKKQLRIAGS